MSKEFQSKLDPVTFEVLKNAFVNLVDQMSEQILRTCYSFVIYSRDFSSCFCDAEGNTVMQGTQDISVHVGTLHLTTKAVLEDFKDDIHPGDVFLVNDPYRGGTHFSDENTDDLFEVVNRSIIETLPRSINTSLTVIFAALFLFLLGGEGIRNFSFALLVGLLAGAYSSIFIAAQVWVVLKGQEIKKKLNQPQTE